MAILFSILLFLIFLSLSIIHFYWAFGGKWGFEGVLPTNENNEKQFIPGKLITLIVGTGLLLLGLFVLLKSGYLTFYCPDWLLKYGFWIIGFVFFIRAIGDFKYAGLFKKVSDTKFSQNDTRYFTPLCLIIGSLCIILELLN